MIGDVILKTISVFKKKGYNIPMFGNTKLFLILIFFNTQVFAGNKLIWSIGKLDKSCDEFALSPKNFQDFVPDGFGDLGQYYTVGESRANVNWPYILPGPKDHFAGYGYWAGLALNQLPIYFEIEDLPQKGTYELIIDILEVSSKQAPLFRAVVNGNAYNHQLKRGESGVDPISLKENSQSILFSIPISQLKEGVNEIIFQNMTGNWCAFDAVRFVGSEKLKIRKPGNSLLRTLEFAGFEMKNEDKRTQPLLVDVLHHGSNVGIRVVVDHAEIEKVVEPGRTILEFYIPAVVEEKHSDVKIYIDGKLKFHDLRKRFPAKEISYADYVDQFMGTSGSRWMITPGPRHPMPMVQLSPNNERWIWKAGYEYQIENLAGFNHSQEWTMAGFLMMPTIGRLQTNPGPEHHPDLGYRSRIDKTTEKAKIGKYSVDLTDYNIHVDLTSTTRAGFQRYIFPESDAAHIIIDAYPPAEYTYRNIDTRITKLSDTMIEGYVHHICDKTGYVLTQDYKLYFVLEFNKPFKNMGGWTDRSKSLEKLNHGLDFDPMSFNTNNVEGSGSVGAFVRFSTHENDTILIRSGISLVSSENALLNLHKEIIEPFDWDFDQVVQNQVNVWNRYLGRIEIESDDYLQKVKFYTNLYRAFSGRVAWGDVNGQWVDMNEEVQTFDDPNQRLCSGEFWNTFWNVQQLDQLVAPEFSSMQSKSLIELYDKGGWLSKGIFGGEYSSVMVAEHSIPWLVGAWNAGIRDFDYNKAYQAMYHVQTTPPLDAHSGGSRVGNESLVSYMKYGYVPLKTGIYQSYVSNTLEYAFDDYCLSQAAKTLNKDQDHEKFLERSNNWRNIQDPETGFMRPKNTNGSWHEPFDPFRTPGFVEGNSWQYSWFVPHDVKGLIDEVGKERFVERLNEGMNQSQEVSFNALGDNFSKYPINHGNQPNMQSCYLFNHAGYPWLTQKWARAIQEKYYGMGPRSAYPGDEDQGQMSAWYVMSTIGLFQMDGGCAITPFYELGSPRFEKITIHLSDQYYGGNTFVIEAKNASRENKYIHSATLNGKKLNSWKFGQKELISGGKLTLEMEGTPNKNMFKED